MKFRRFILLLLAAAPASQAFVREDDNNIPLAWVKDRTILMQLSLGGPHPLSDGFQSFNESARDALNIWNQYLAHLQFSPVMNSPVTPSNGDDLMSAAFSATVFGKAWESGTLAVTLLNFRGGNFEETDTLFNNRNYTWDSYRGPLRTQIDFHRVAIHEFGHTLGLDHPDDHGQTVSAIMNAHVSNIDYPTSDDINGVRSIYGTGPAYQTIPNSPVLMNLSTRGVTNTGNNVMIGGFIVEGSQPDTFIVRSLAGSLESFGISNALFDSVIELYNSSNHLIASNDDWFVSNDAERIASYRRDPPDSIESALIVTLNPGSYTVIVKSYSSASQPAGNGVALFEVYDLRTSSSRAINMSTRGQVGTGDNVLIGGFVVGGSVAKPLIIRAIGPSLAQFNVTGILSDPKVELRDINGNLLKANDNWQQGSDAATVSAARKAPADPRESAIAATLIPGNYTAIVSGVNGTTGVALIEIYDQS